MIGDRKMFRALQVNIEDDNATPEVKLVLALLIQAMRDALDGDPRARLWLVGPAFEHWCDLIDVSPERMRARLAEVRR